jgi:transcription elongation GreA/GreB family factor
MTASAPSPSAVLSSEVEALIDQKKFEELEDLWTRRMEQAPSDLSFFFGVASAVKKKGSGASALSWLRFLADYQAERGDEDSRLSVLMEMARMSPTEAEIRPELAAALHARYASHPALSAVLAQNSLEKAADPAAVAAKIRRWLSFLPGDISYLPGRGPGRIVEMNPALDVIRVDFSGTRLPFSLVAAEKTLVTLPGGHFLREKIEQPQKLAALVENDPAEVVRWLLDSFGRPMALAEIKEHLTGLIEESRWGGFWAAARKHPQLLVSGAGKTATVSWSTSADEAEEKVRRSFAQAPPAEKIEIARRNSKRTKELTGFFGETLAVCAREAAATEPALAWELSQAASKLLPGEREAFPAERLLESRDLISVLAQIHDQAGRQAAMEAIRQRRSDWADLYAEQFLREEDGRVLSVLFQRLGETPERREELSRRILRAPRQAPRAFVWLCERLLAEGAAAPPHLFFALLDALRQEEFSGLRARVKEFFDPGNLAVSLARAADSEEKAREYLDALDRVSRLEEHRRSVVKEALLMTFPGLRAPAREYLYATAEAIETRRGELARLRQVELPANAEAMRAAKEHGDLSENFEYHAARQRHEYLSARIATLTDELSRSRALDPARTDTSQVRVGTRVTLREIGTGAEKSATILGPWDSRPEESVYSYESDFAQQLLGKKAGDRVSVAGVETEVVQIAPWR